MKIKKTPWIKILTHCPACGYAAVTMRRDIIIQPGISDTGIWAAVRYCFKCKAEAEVTILPVYE